MDRSTAEALDHDDPLAPTRERFDLPDGLIYLDGNSLGPLAKGVRERVGQVVAEQWGHDLITSWNQHGWWDLPDAVGGKIAPLIGATPDEVVVSDATSVQLFKLITAAARLRSDRKIIVSEPGNFPTNSYIAASAAELLGMTVRMWDSADEPDIAAVLDDDVAVVSLCHVDYRLGRMHDGAAVTRAVHDAGAVVVWDLCHSAGAVEVLLDEWDADLAAGCGYKYLNGGPGAPSFAYVNRRLIDVIEQPISGWHGHAAPFALERDYRPYSGIRRMQTGSNSVIAMSALDAALDAFDGVTMAKVRTKSLALTDFFVDLVEQRLGEFGAAPEVPRAHDKRGSQACVRLDNAYGFVQALIKRGVVGDFREPDLARFGFTPLYLRFVDVWDAVDQMAQVLEGGEHERPENTDRAPVT
jgi:kynureninase